MTDDPIQILRDAGIECPEVEEWSRYRYSHEYADVGYEAVLALARLVAKYKWQRDYVIDIAEEYGGCDFTGPDVVSLDVRWEARDDA